MGKKHRLRKYLVKKYQNLRQIKTFSVPKETFLLKRFCENQLVPALQSWVGPFMGNIEGVIDLIKSANDNDDLICMALYVKDNTFIAYMVDCEKGEERQCLEKIESQLFDLSASLYFTTMQTDFIIKEIGK